MSDFWTWLETRPIAMAIGPTWLFPFFESVHVLAATFVVGSILMLDLRLLGFAGRSYSVTQIARDVIRWTIGAFIVAVSSGLAMFITQPTRYMDNPAFRVKLVLLLFAVLNMVVFHSWSKRSIAGWNTGRASPAARWAGGVSLVLWIGVMLSGRWTGHLLEGLRDARPTERRLPPSPDG